MHSVVIHLHAVSTQIVTLIPAEPRYVAVKMVSITYPVRVPLTAVPVVAKKPPHRPVDQGGLRIIFRGPTGFSLRFFQLAIAILVSPVLVVPTLVAPVVVTARSVPVVPTILVIRIQIVKLILANKILVVLMLSVKRLVQELFANVLEVIFTQFLRNFYLFVRNFYA
jgi:hypothetical protein